MKIYRCVIGCLLVFFLVVGVWYIATNINEQRSIEDGLLIWREEDVTDYGLC